MWGSQLFELTIEIPVVENNIHAHPWWFNPSIYTCEQSPQPLETISPPSLSRKASWQAPKNSSLRLLPTFIGSLTNLSDRRINAVSVHLLIQAFNAIIIAVLHIGYKLSSSVATTAPVLMKLVQHVSEHGVDWTRASLQLIICNIINMLLLNAIIIAVLHIGYNLSNSVATTAPVLMKLVQHVSERGADCTRASLQHIICNVINMLLFKHSTRL